MSLQIGGPAGRGRDSAPFVPHPRRKNQAVWKSVGNCHPTASGFRRTSATVTHAFHPQEPGIILAPEVQNRMSIHPVFLPGKLFRQINGHGWISPPPAMLLVIRRMFPPFSFRADRTLTARALTLSRNPWGVRGSRTETYWLTALFFLAFCFTSGRAPRHSRLVKRSISSRGLDGIVKERPYQRQDGSHPATPPNAPIGQGAVFCWGTL